jgi:hypothetical protein
VTSSKNFSRAINSTIETISVGPDSELSLGEASFGSALLPDESCQIDEEQTTATMRSNRKVSA